MIRRARAEDVDAIARLYERSYATLTFLPTLHTLEEYLGWFGARVAEDEVWVYDENGAVLGFASLEWDRFGYLYVEPEAIGRGIGTALFEHAKTRRPDGFTFWVFQRNERARRFYERLGARPVRFTDGAGNEERTPDVQYEWRPTSPGPAGAAGDRGPSGR
jgi:GNAT superfamily N-acetyltransferase